MSKDWPLVKLGEVMMLSDTAVPTADLEQVNLAGVYSFGRGLFARGPMFPKDTSYKVYNRLVTDDFVISQPKAWEGALARVRPEFNGWYLSPVFPTFRTNRDQLDPCYLEWFCKRQDVWHQLQRNSRGIGARRETVSPETFLALQIPLPPLTEQKRTVAKIERLAGKIEEARSLQIININNYGYLFDIIRSSILSNALKDGDKKLIDVVVLERGKFSHRPRNDPRFFGGDHPWIQISEIETSDKYIRYWYQTLNDEGLSISRKFQKGTLLISIAATIGAVGILEFDCCVPDSIIGVIPKEEIDTEFLFYYFSYLRNHLEEIAPQSAQKNINLQILSQLPFSDISIKDQRAIAAYLNVIKSKIDSLKAVQSQTTADLDALLPSILDKAFKGEL